MCKRIREGYIYLPSFLYVFIEGSRNDGLSLLLSFARHHSYNQHSHQFLLSWASFQVAGKLSPTRVGGTVMLSGNHEGRAFHVLLFPGPRRVSSTSTFGYIVFAFAIINQSSVYYIAADYHSLTFSLV